MRPLSVDNSSLLTLIVPGITFLFVLFSPVISETISSSSGLKNLILVSFNFFSSPSKIILIGVASIVVGKIIDFVRINLLYVPREFIQIIYEQTDNPTFLRRRQILAKIVEGMITLISRKIKTAGLLVKNKLENIAVILLPRNESSDDSGPNISREYIAQDTDDQNGFASLIFSSHNAIDNVTKQQIIRDVRREYALENSNSPRSFYSFILKDISESKTQKTDNIESIYVFYNNTIISIMFAFLLNPVALTPSPGKWSQIIITTAAFILFIMVTYSDFIGVGEKYTNQILLEYYAKNKDRIQKRYEY